MVKERQCWMQERTRMKERTRLGKNVAQRGGERAQEGSLAHSLQVRFKEMHTTSSKGEWERIGRGNNTGKGIEA
jgi:hypothetical protein